MRFDDLLGTVRGIDLDTAAGAAAAWRQVVDLVGRGRAQADGWVVDTLTTIRDRVPVEARAASARALYGAAPPIDLVRLLATDTIAVAAPLLRSAVLSDADWVALLPALGPGARAVLRHRRDLSNAVTRALDSFGSVDFVIEGEVATAAVDPAPTPAPAPVMPEPHPAAMPVAADPGPFVSLGSVARGLPLVAEALRRENDNEAPPAPAGTFRIADVVARLQAFQERQGDPAPSERPAALPQPDDRFRFETDATGAIRWVDGIPRGAILGLSIATPARPTLPGVDGAAAGAFRTRSRIARAHLLIGGGAPASGRWLFSAEPAFDRATGRFTGYLGSAFREGARSAKAADAPRPDSLRQLAHELRTPTNAIAGFSEMIEHAMLGPVADPYRAQAATMRQDAGRLLAAIDDMDAAARIDAGALPLHPEPLAIASTLTAATRDLTELAAGRGVVLTVAGEDAIALADARSVERLVGRLVGAMVGAAREGETIAVVALPAVGDRVGISVTRPAALDAYPGDAVLAIDDEDSPATLLGLGFALRLVRNLAVALGGTLRIGEREMTVFLPSALGGAVSGTRRS